VGCSDIISPAPLPTATGVPTLRFLAALVIIKLWGPSRRLRSRRRLSVEAAHPVVETLKFEFSTSFTVARKPERKVTSKPLTLVRGWQIKVVIPLA